MKDNTQIMFLSFVCNFIFLNFIVTLFHKVVGYIS